MRFCDSLLFVVVSRFENDFQEHMKTEKAVVVFSGGQDSTTCLYWAKREYKEVIVLTFDYGQRHRIELDCARQIATMADVPQVVLPVNTFENLAGNALIDSSMKVQDTVSEDELPNTFVPARNIIFLSFAAAFAYQRSFQTIVTGVSQADYSNYPDCRDETMQSLQQTLCLGLDSPVHIETPLMHLSKAATVKLALECGAMEALAYSHTCYQGMIPPCMSCPSCLLRQKGFEEAGVQDPLLERIYQTN